MEVQEEGMGVEEEFVSLVFMVQSNKINKYLFGTFTSCTFIIITCNPY